MNIEEYGITAEMTEQSAGGIPARVTAVHKERYEIVCAHGETHARLKTREYFVDGDHLDRWQYSPDCCLTRHIATEFC